MTILGYNTGVNLIKSSGSASTLRYPFSTDVRGIDTMIDHTLPLFAFKVCSTCGEAKPHSEYHKGNANDGLRHACKACTNAQNRGIYYQNHESHLEAKRRYRRENPDARRATIAQHEQRHAEKRDAYHAVWHAIKRGELPRPSTLACAKCQAPAEIYHHHSYEEQYWLDVEPLCRTCHGKEHHAHD